MDKAHEVASAAAAAVPSDLVARIKRARADGGVAENREKSEPRVEDRWEMIKAMLIEHAGKTKNSKMNWFDYDVAPEDLSEQEAEQIERFAHQEGLKTGFVILKKVACKDSDCYAFCHCPPLITHRLQFRWS